MRSIGQQLKRCLNAIRTTSTCLTKQDKLTISKTFSRLSCSYKSIFNKNIMTTKLCTFVRLVTYIWTNLIRRSINYKELVIHLFKNNRQDCCLQWHTLKYKINRKVFMLSINVSKNTINSKRDSVIVENCTSNFNNMTWQKKTFFTLLDLIQIPLSVGLV